MMLMFVKLMKIKIIIWLNFEGRVKKTIKIKILDYFLIYKRKKSMQLIISII